MNERLTTSTAEPTDKGSIFERQVSRRLFVKAFGAMTVAAHVGFAADTIHDGLDMVYRTEAEIWPENEPKLTFLDGESYIGQPEAAVLLPGFGDMNAAKAAAEWKASGKLPQDLPTCYLEYSNQGATIDELVELIRSNIDVDNLEAINLFGNSMGGLYATEIASRLGVPVRSLILCSSPSSFDNAYFGKASRLIAALPPNRTVDTAVKGIASAHRARTVNPDATTEELIHDTVRRTVSGGDPVALHNELQQAYKIDITDKDLIQRLGNVFVPDFSNVAYVASDEPHTDTVVQVTKSGMDYKKLFNDELGVAFSLFGANYDGHANVRRSVAATSDWQEEVQLASPFNDIDALEQS